MANFEKLSVWQLAKNLAVDIYEISNHGKLSTDYGLRDQMRRAAVSIPSNIAEGEQLGSNLQSIRHLYIARGSAAELYTQAIIAKEINYLNSEVFSNIENKYNQISGMLTRLIQARQRAGNSPPNPKPQTSNP